MEHLADLPCIGLEAAPDRVADYAHWGFVPASPTTRWQAISDGSTAAPPSAEGWQLLTGGAIPERAVQWFDAQREPSPRPHFLSQWLQHPAGSVLALIDADGSCHGFGRIRPCLLERLQFRPVGTTVRMYRGEAPAVSLRDVYGLACLELG